MVPVDLHARILADNDRLSAHNRDHFARLGIFTLNLMGSPGSGKTALLEATAKRLGGSLRLGAVSGDLATDRDAERLRAAGIPAVSITTGSACHLDAQMIHRSLHRLPLSDLDLFVIENVGNLVCPAVYDLGQNANVVTLSVTEGEDKPLKYPVMFAKVGLVILTKTDLLPHLPGVTVSGFAASLARVMPDPKLIPLSALNGDGLDAWISWLSASLARAHNRQSRRSV
jgi:hydrogenase nickel incorporation protein HypB